MKHTINITETYYNSWERLLELLNQKLDFYLCISQIFLLLKDCGLRPDYMLDVTHPAYFTDDIACHCLATYDPAEPLDSALERCITDKLHQHMTCMESTDLSKVRMDECIWEQYPLDALLRLAWRHRGENLQIPFCLQKESQAKLSDRFLLEVPGHFVRLTQCTHDRQYEADTAESDFDSFCQQMDYFFRLATEDYGYFVPAFVWISHMGMKEVSYD